MSIPDSGIEEPIGEPDHTEDGDCRCYDCRQFHIDEQASNDYDLARGN